MFGVSSLLFGDVENGCLDWCEPEGEGAGKVFDQDADKTLQRAEDGAVQHDRCVAGVVLANVFGTETLRHGKVDLDRSALPGAADGVLDMEFDLRAVERAFARQFVPFEAGCSQPFAQCKFRLVPDFVVANALFWAQRELYGDLMEAEVGVDLAYQCIECGDFGLYLVFGTEDVAVVLGEAAYAHDAVQGAGGFVAVA